MEAANEEVREEGMQKRKNGVWEVGRDEEKDGREKERREGERER